MDQNNLRLEELSRVLRGAYSRDFSARIFDYKKSEVNFRVYVTDQNGIVLYDSQNPDLVGKDYSQWNDVYLTLRGKYGARSTRDDPDDPFSGAIYVAAPIYHAQTIAGVVTIAKPKDSILHVVRSARSKLIRAGFIVGISMVVAFFMVFIWITSPIRKLIRYVHRVQEDRRTTLPRLGSTEIKDLGNAFESMRQELEGRKYVEQYVQTLTHEIKSPLSSIRGAAEILQEEPPEDKKRLFLQNIERESQRIEEIVHRLLNLASLESRKELKENREIDLCELIEDLMERFSPEFEKQSLRVHLQCEKERFYVKGELFLLRQMISNLIQNAVDFAYPSTDIEVSAAVGERSGGTDKEKEKQKDKYLIIRIVNSGDPIPDYAKDRIYERFYSLPGGQKKRKSSGLGLPFAREAAHLHRGSVAVRNIDSGKVEAIVELPLSGMDQKPARKY